MRFGFEKPFKEQTVDVYADVVVFEWQVQRTRELKSCRTPQSLRALALIPSSTNRSRKIGPAFLEKAEKKPPDQGMIAVQRPIVKVHPVGGEPEQSVRRAIPGPVAPDSGGAVARSASQKVF